MASNFVHLLLVRAGVAVGEAGTVPAAQSLLADYFDRIERPRAMSIYMTFYTISMIFGYLIGGWLVESVGWRITFLIIGIPNILTAFLVKYTLKEPRLQKPNAILVVSPTFTETLKALWCQRSFRHIFIAFCVSYFFSLGVSQWQAVFFIRSYSMPISEVGAWLALAWGVFGTLGNYLGGYCASRYAASQEKLQMRAVSIVFVITVVVNLMIYLSPSKYLALMFISFSAFLTTLVGGPVFATIQTLVAVRMRSVSVALIFMFANLIGFGLGPLFLGVLSDFMNPIFGQESLRYALAVFCPGSLWVAVHYWKAADTVESDINKNESEESSTELDVLNDSQLSRQGKT